MNKKCIFCDEKAATREHIIPRWLQKKFDLKDQLLGLGNKTNLFYKQTLIPACKQCNSEKFSLIEKRVKDGIASKQEYYIWALKIRFCLSVKDTTLPFDRSDPSKGQLLEPTFAMIGVEFIKQSFANVDKKFFYNPYPFGSVFLFGNPIKDYGFGFVDIPHPYWALTISLPENRVLSVLFTDRGLVKKDLEKRYKKIGGLNTFYQIEDSIKLTTQDYIKIITFKLLLAQYNLANIPYGFSIKPNGICSRKVPKKIKYREKLQKERFYEIANFCSLDNEYAQLLYDRLPESRKSKSAFNNIFPYIK